MNAPQEGRAGGPRPTPSGSGSRGRPGAGKGGGSPVPREVQAFLPGLGGPDEGWTVFGSEEEDEEALPAEASGQASGAEPEVEGAPEGPLAAAGPDPAPPEPPPSEPPPPSASPAAPASPETAEGPPDVAEAGGTPAEGTAPGAEAAPVAAPRAAAIGPGRPPLPPASGPTRSVTRSGLPLPWAIVLLVALATAIAGVFTAHLRGTVGPMVAGGDGGRGDPPTVPGDPSAEEVGRLEGELDALRVELVRAREEAARTGQLRAELETSQARMESRIELLEGLLGEVRERVEQEQSVPEEAVLAESKPPEATPSDPQAALAAAAPDPEPGQPLSARPPQPSGVDRAPDPRAQRARGLDDLLTALESGRASDGLRRLEELRSRGVFPDEAPAGSGLLLALAEGWLALESAEGTSAAGPGSPDVGLLEDSAAHLARARGLRPGFEAAAASWLGAAGPPSARPDRLERLDRSIAGLERRIAEADAEVELQHERDWRWILELGLPQDPDLALRHADRFGCEHDAVLLASTVDAWTGRCVQAGEVLPGELSAAAHLRAWGERVAARDPRERGAKEDEVLWLWHALRWYVDGDDPNRFDWRGLDVPEVLAPRDDWRAELRLAVELAQPGSGWPPAEGTLAVFAVEAAGPARWRVDEVVRGERPDGPVRLLRRHFDADGAALGGAAEVGLERSGQRFVYAGGEALLLDLHAVGADVSVAPCPLAARDLPPELEGVDLHDVASMDLRPGELARSCLVQRDGEWTRWFAPGLGLVREERNGLDGTVRIELCALGSVP